MTPFRHRSAGPEVRGPAPAANARGAAIGRDDHRRRNMLVVVIGLALLVLRRPDAFLNPQFWAEDFGFLIDAEKSGLASFLTPQAGYLHLIPRSIAWPASHLDPLLQPGFFVLGWLLVALAVVFACLSPRHDLPLKPWLAIAVLIVPHSGEVFFNPTNAQWVAALGLLLTILKRDPATPAEWLADLGFLFFAGLSGPFIIFSLPLFIPRLWRRRSAASAVLCAVALILAAVQGWFVHHGSPDTEFVGPFSLFNLVAKVSFRLPCDLFFGVLVTGATGPRWIVALAAVVLGFLGGAIYRSPRHRAELAWLLAFVVWLLAATTLRKRFDLWGWGDLENGDRYFFIPKVVLLWVTGIVFAAAGNRWVKRTALALLVCSTLSNLPRFPFRPYRDYEWYAKCPAIRAHQEVEVTINPGWRFRYRRGSMASAGPL